MIPTSARIPDDILAGWRAAQQQLEFQSDRATWTLYLEQLELTGCDIGAGSLTFSVQTAAALDMCRHGLYRFIRATLATAYLVETDALTVIFERRGL